MTPDEFRRLALAQPEAVESAHHGAADFRVRKKIFATLDEPAGVGTLKLPPETQETLIALAGDAVYPANGAWGAKGWTKLDLGRLDAGRVAPWMQQAWSGVAPVALRRKHEETP